MEIKSEIFELKLNDTFRISRGALDFKKIVIVEIGSGLGEAAPSPYYGEWFQSVLDFLQLVESELGTDLLAIDEIEKRLHARMGLNFAAKAAINIALYDHISKQAGLPLYRYLGLPRPEHCLTSYTISIAQPETVRRRAQQMHDYPIFKVKVGVPGDLEIVRTVREVSPARIRVDANCGWSVKEALQKIRELENLGVELIEAPINPVDIEGLRFLREHTSLPIFVDEGICTTQDIYRYAGAVDGINIKLMKCGGIREGLRMIHTARSLNLQIMLGCMIESSVGITAAAHLASKVDFLDLDSILLIENDPFRGVSIDRGQIILPTKVGLGVERVV